MLLRRTAGAVLVLCILAAACGSEPVGPTPGPPPGPTDALTLAYNVSHTTIRLTDPAGTEQYTVPREGRVQAWAPDGSVLLVVTGLNGISLLDPDDGALTELVPSDVGFGVNSFRWAPDGQAVLYNTSVGQSQNRQLQRLHLDGSFKGQLTPLGGCESSWSPDGSRIVIKAASRTGAFQSGLYLVDADGGNPTFLTVGHYPRGLPRGTPSLFPKA